MAEKLIGRHREKADLLRWIDSDKSEFIAIYGRRRVGKTFLVKKVVGDEFTFHFSGSYGAKYSKQLLNFGLAMREQGQDREIGIPENWILAFDSLKQLIKSSERKKKIIFLDELPWLDTPRSGFISALENFWNDWASWRDDVKLIVCGSATSWIINKIIKDKGGLHNRITHLMLVHPFQLEECEDYFRSRGFTLTRMQIAECYMTMGGIPYYLSLMEKGESLAQNIDRMFFRQDAPLKNEFNDLYRALYKNYNAYIGVIRVLAQKGIGMTRREILDKSRITDNGTFSKILEELELCGFIRSYKPFESKSNRQKKHLRTSSNTLYQLIDFYSLFYLKFEEEMGNCNGNFWVGKINSPQLNAWRGITFEMLCQCHVNRIKEALGIGDVATRICSWRGEYNDRKVQIDLLIDRNDDTINMCEMKFSRLPFVIDKQYSENLLRKMEIFLQETGTRKNLLLTMVTASGLKPNSYSSVIQRQVTLDQLF